MTPFEYQNIASVPGLFFVFPGHEHRGHESVVVSTGRYSVVTAVDVALAEAA